MKKRPEMLIEHTFAFGDLPQPFPDEPGMEYGGSIIPDDQKMNPNCVCRTRTCPLHGFCQYCAQHHREINRIAVANGATGGCHFHHCKMDKLTELHGLEYAEQLAYEEALCAVCGGRAEREARDLPDYLTQSKED